ncbi:ABC transporter ATP-binding protein [Facklamia sp. DSM 111018]|uniref:ABC transporter ATP-binding protein n=1 Tax=Facklamia lactis TaxID=2749967 RepID=A0ABS0LQR7_9LACT|nr:ABC transporter ATP-binding protein [Facklamia lactis]MBG9986349.1 ABC transporter ATP-binding protein [Facklamia lactis]
MEAIQKNIDQSFNSGNKTPLIQIINLNKYYKIGEEQVQILKDTNLEIYRGEFVSIMGPSGSGKSTLINVLGFLDNKFEGEFRFNGKALEHRTDKQISYLRNQVVGFVFQDFNLISTLTVKENIRLPLLYAGYSARKTNNEVKCVLEKVGLSDKENHKPSELSGGQKQRVAIARALITKPDFIIADEPTGALDTKNSLMVMEILEKLHQEEGVTVVMVTHDPTLQKFADRHIVIVDGRVSKVDRILNAEELSIQFNKMTNSDEEEKPKVGGGLR